MTRRVQPPSAGHDIELCMKLAYVSNRLHTCFGSWLYRHMQHENSGRHPACAVKTGCYLTPSDSPMPGREIRV